MIGILRAHLRVVRYLRTSLTPYIFGKLLFLLIRSVQWSIGSDTLVEYRLASISSTSPHLSSRVILSAHAVTEYLSLTGPLSLRVVYYDDLYPRAFYRTH
jgi:hypothetical protein